MKRYRRPKVYDDQIKMQRGKIDGSVDMCVFWGDGVPRCDRALIFNYMCCDNINYNGGEYPSLLKELEERGYDLDTLKFSIQKKS